MKASQLEFQTHAWTYCPLSQLFLSAPIVSDCAGILYNKDAVIEYLLPNDDPSNNIKTEYEEVLTERIKSLRDVVEVKFQTEKGSAITGEKRVCPITSKELGAHTKAVYIVPCGHAFSEAALKVVAGETCLQCGESYDAENIIPVLPLAKEDTTRLAERMRTLKDHGLTHSLKKAPGGKKRKKGALPGPEEAHKMVDVSRPGNTETEKARNFPTIKLTDAPKKSGSGSQSMLKSDTTTPIGGIKNATTASLTSRVLNEQEEKNKRRKLGLNDNLKSLFSKTESDESKKKGDDFMTRGYSIPKKT